ncbi:MAG TPA: hypothetical protein VFP30_05460 [Candidatus Limnocylindria bacterium]|nr:hypothetical protein [Candidatus Limnocylindria bacterium]
MTDEQIREYLRSRSDGTPPADLLGSISQSVTGRAQERRSWFTSFAPALAGLGLTAAVIVGAIVLSQSPDVGPPAGSTAPSISTPDESIVSRPSPTPPPSASASDSGETGSLTDAGGIVTGPAQDSEGRWGTITLERLPDLGGLREIVAADIDEANPDPASLYFVNDPAMFYVEVTVEYAADREPVPPDFGSDDWVIAGGPEPIRPLQVGFDALASHLPGAMAVVGEPIHGVLRFAVPRELASTELRLSYVPVGSEHPAWIVPLRLPGDPPEPFTMTPPSTEGLAEVAAAEAEALFATADTCTNPVAGYTVTFPDAWYTNTAIGPWPACSWFSPTFFEVDDPDVVPDEVMIVLTYTPNAGPFGIPSVALSGGETEVGGRPATRAEYVGVGGGFIEIGSFLSVYEVAMDGQALDEGDTGDVLSAAASWAIDDDPAEYRLATAVLDRIMASLTFDE